MQNQLPPHLSDLVHRLNSKDDPTRQHAQDDLRVLIAADVRRMRRMQSAFRGSNAVYLLLFFPAYLYCVVTSRFWMGRPSSDIGLISLVFLGVVAVFFGMQYLLPSLQKRTARRIIALDLPQAIGPLIDVQANSGLFPGGAVRTALLRLLPRLRSNEANLLQPRQRKYLNNFLCNDEVWPISGKLFGADLKIAILRALEQVGDATSLPAVERLAKSGRNPQVRTAAQECLPFLHQRVDHSDTEQTLLRASGAGTAPEVLLRPASNTEETAPQQLLRASTVDKP